MVLAMAWPCAGPRSNVRRISRSRVPCSSSMRSFCSLVDILGENKSLPVECQCESPHDKSRIVEASEEPYSTLWALISITGCRAGEILGLKTTGLDFEKHLIRIRRTLYHATRTMQAPRTHRAFRQSIGGCDLHFEGRFRCCGQRDSEKILRQQGAYPLHSLFQCAGDFLSPALTEGSST